jgi:hypothetical protein
LRRIIGRSNVAPWSSRQRNLSNFARHQGYRLDELLKIIRNVG